VKSDAEVTLRSLWNPETPLFDFLRRHIAFYSGTVEVHLGQRQRDALCDELGMTRLLADEIYGCRLVIEDNWDDLRFITISEPPHE